MMHACHCNSVLRPIVHSCDRDSWCCLPSVLVSLVHLAIEVRFRMYLPTLFRALNRDHVLAPLVDFTYVGLIVLVVHQVSFAPI